MKENELQTIEQLSDGDKLRVVTSEGGSRNIDANKVGGRNNVEKIFLGQFGGGVSDLGNGMRMLACGGNFADEKTLEDIIGNKRIICFILGVTYEMSNSRICYEETMYVRCSIGTARDGYFTHTEEAIGIQNEDVVLQTGGVNFFGLMWNASQIPAGSYQIDAYAICI